MSVVRLVALAGALIVAVQPASAQSILNRVKQKVTDKANATVDQTTDNAINAATNAPGKAATGTDTTKKAAASAATPAGATAGGAGATAAAPGEPTVFVNYDFVPGDRVIWTEDFASDKVGDFPKRLELVNGNMEVAKRDNQTWLRAPTSGQVTIALPEVLPDRFTFEVDYIVASGWSLNVGFMEPNQSLTEVQFAMQDGGLHGGNVTSEGTIPDAAALPVAHLAVMADGQYVKAYINGVRVSNVPKANLGRGKSIYIDLTGSQDEPAFITNIRVAAGGKKLYDALASSGKVSTHGILFATASDQIRAESKPTLQEIADMLKAHADLKLLIAGHTDNVGAAPDNQSLSDRRAAAVKQYLVANYAVDGSRLTTKGYGATQPVVPNTTAEGRQTNRRVELVKQ